MLNLELVPCRGQTLAIVSYVDLTTTYPLIEKRKIFDDLDEAREFINHYIDDLKVYIAGDPIDPTKKWIWEER